MIILRRTVRVLRRHLPIPVGGHLAVARHFVTVSFRRHFVGARRAGGRRVGGSRGGGTLAERGRGCRAIVFVVVFERFEGVVSVRCGVFLPGRVGNELVLEND